MDQRAAIRHINQSGALLVFPIGNAKEPPSLWYRFFPKTRMRWEWDESGDNRVAELWHLRAQLSQCDKVVYAKWYQGRATFFSRELFTALLRLLRPDDSGRDLGPEARDILSRLQESSPLSPRELKRACGLEGRPNETRYNRALKQLWNRLYIVGYGEIEDGAFPSLALGATDLLFEDLWRESRALRSETAKVTVETYLPANSAFGRFLKKQLPPEGPAPTSGPERPKARVARFVDGKLTF